MFKKIFLLIFAASLAAVQSCDKEVSKPGTDQQVIACSKDLPDSGSDYQVLPGDGSESATFRNGSGPYVLNILVHLIGEDEVPSVTTSARGEAHLRLTADRVLYSKVIVENLDEGDGLLFSHVHAGPAGVSGPVRIFLCHNADEFGKNIVQTLTEAQYDLLLNQACYVNAHSTFHPPGLVRGQIR